MTLTLLEIQAHNELALRLSRYRFALYNLFTSHQLFIPTAVELADLLRLDCALTNALYAAFRQYRRGNSNVWPHFYHLECAGHSLCFHHSAARINWNDIDVLYPRCIVWPIRFYDSVDGRIFIYTKQLRGT
jgi:hypothetical protein